MKLYEIANEYQRALADLDDLFMQDDGDQLVLDSLSSIVGEFSDKAKAVAAYIKNKEAEVTAIKNAIDDLRARAISKAKQVDSLKDYLLFNMKAMGLKQIDDPINPIKICKNPPRLVIDESILDVSLLEEKRTIQFVPMKDKIKDMLKEDPLSVIGAKLEQGERLSFK